MAHTEIRTLTNDTGAELLLVDMEDGSKNKYAGRAAPEINAPVPWASNPSEGLAKPIMLINWTTRQVFGFIWQDTSASGNDHVRFSRHGWQPPSKDNRLPGDDSVGEPINLVVDKDFKVTGVKAK